MAVRPLSNGCGDSSRKVVMIHLDSSYDMLQFYMDAPSTTRSFVRSSLASPPDPKRPKIVAEQRSGPFIKVPQSRNQTQINR